MYCINFIPLTLSCFNRVNKMNNKLNKIPFFPIYFLIKMVIKNGGISLKCTPLFITYTIRYFLLEPFRILEILVYHKKIRNLKLIQDPIFIIGHWRSGTSHLQNLLCKDQNHTSTTIFNFIFSDAYYLTELWLKKPLNIICKLFKVKYAFQRLPMNFDIQGELDPALCANCSDHSYTWGHLFPKNYEYWLDKYIVIQNKQCALDWINDYDFLIRKLSFRNKNKRIIVKSPGDTGRFELLLKKYPNAKFIYIHRNPIDVFHSTKNLWSIIQKQNSFQKISEATIEEYIIQTYKKVLLKYIETRTIIPQSQLAEITFNEIQNNPIKVIREIYEKFNLGSLPQKELDSFVQSNKCYKVNQYSKASKIEERLLKEWDFSFSEWPNS